MALAVTFEVDAARRGYEKVEDEVKLFESGAYVDGLGSLLCLTNEGISGSSSSGIGGSICDSNVVVTIG